MTAPVLRVLSLGAGVQSSTLYLMACVGEFGDERPSVAIFADTQWEPAGVYAWLIDLERIGGAVIPIVRVTRENIRVAALRTERRRASMPVFTSGLGARPEGRVKRQCTGDFKVEPIQKYIRRELLGVGFRCRVPAGKCAELWIGISLDEVTRMKDSRVGWISHRWPLIDRGMTRHSCERWLTSHGYPTPPKSACIGCPYTDDGRWREMKRDRPAEFADAVAFDDAIRHGGGFTRPAYLHRSLQPLDEVDFASAEDLGQTNLFENECEGMCGV